MASNDKIKVRVKDRISDLPDAILCHILSFFPTIYAVRTSTLSTRWKKVWASVPSCLDFFPTNNVEYSCSDFEFYQSFLMFCNRVLLYRGSSDIYKFRLGCWKDDHQFPLIDGWICSAIMRNVVELDLDVPGDSRLFELPRSLFMSKTLRVLKLMSSFTINTPKSWCLPSLKVLVVTVDRPDNDPVRELLPCCPAIEDLTIKGVVEHDVSLHWHISALELKTLTIILEADYLPETPKYGYIPETPYSGGYFNGKNDGTITIRAPKLEKLDIDERILSLYLLDTGKSFAKATIHLNSVQESNYPAFVYRATALLEQISNVKYLSLPADCVKACHLPTFHKLRQLELVLHSCCSWWAEWLKRSPNLESLVLDLSKLFTYNCKFARHQWDSPESVPSCLVSHLKTASLRNYSGMPDEIEVVKYLLEKGEVLESLTLYRSHFLCVQSRSCACYYFSGSTGFSKTCHVELKEDVTSASAMFF